MRGDRPVPQWTGRVISRTGAQLLAAAVGILTLMWIRGSVPVPEVSRLPNTPPANPAATATAVVATASTVPLPRRCTGRWCPGAAVTTPDPAAPAHTRSIAAVANVARLTLTANTIAAAGHRWSPTIYALSHSIDTGRVHILHTARAQDQLPWAPLPG